MAELRRIAASAPVEDVIRVLEEDGGVIVENLIDAATVAAIISRGPCATPWSSWPRARSIDRAASANDTD